MLRTVDKHRLYELERVWFEYTDSSKADIVRFTRCDSPGDKKWYTIVDEHITVINELRKSDDEIISEFKKNVRYEIRRAIREGVVISHIDRNEISHKSSTVAAFVKAYEDCAKSIDGYNLMDAFSERKLHNFIENKCVHFSVAKKDDLKVYHVYVHDEKEAVLIYSISNFRDDKENEYLAGMANKLLHFDDMKYFRNLGLSIYDWGNISSEDNPNGIDKFKMSFGGNVKRLYSTFYGNSVKGKILILAKKVFKK